MQPNSVNSVVDARQFFAKMTPLKSFDDCSPESFVRSIRDKSRILRNKKF